MGPSQRPAHAAGHRFGSGQRIRRYLTEPFHRQCRDRDGWQRRETAPSDQPTLGDRTHIGARQRQHCRDHQESADLRHRAARQQHPDRRVPEPPRECHERRRRRAVRSRCRPDEPGFRRRRGAALRRGYPRSDRRTVAAVDERHPEPRRQQTQAGKCAARGAQRHRQRLQHLQPRQWYGRRRFRDVELRRSRVGGLLSDCGSQECHGSRIVEVVRAVSRPSPVADQLQLPTTADECLSPQGTESGESGLHRPQTRPRRKRFPRRVPNRAPGGVGLHRYQRRHPSRRVGRAAGPPGAYAPNGLPADPAPALFPGAPVPQPAAASSPQAPTVRDLLLPAEAAPAAPNPGGTP